MKSRSIQLVHTFSELSGTSLAENNYERCCDLRKLTVLQLAVQQGLFIKFGSDAWNVCRS